MNGATTRQPAPASTGATLRQPCAVSGNPCRHNAIGPSSGPHVSARSVASGVTTSKLRGSIRAIGLYGLELGDQPFVALLVERHPHTRSRVGRRGGTDDDGLIDEYQYHGVIGSADTPAARGTGAAGGSCWWLGSGRPPP